MNEITQFTPLGWIYIIQGVPFDSSYKHTRWFESEGEQHQYFLQKSTSHWNNATPVRPGQPVRLPCNMNQIYRANYIMYQNTNYNNKWFYAFITDIKWLSVNSCEVYYELDVIQTWMFDFVYRECFVNREHSSTDMPGDNLIEEGLELGEYIFESQSGTGKFINWRYLVAATVDGTGADAVGGIYAGVYSGLAFNVFSSPSALNTYLETLVDSNKGDAIVSITMFPEAFIAEKGSAAATTKTISQPKSNGYSTATIDGYSPKNKKLLTYPYNFLFCSNLAGAYANFPYEYFSSENCQFKIMMDMTANPTAIIIPLYYKGVSENYNEKLTMDGFPQCSWTTDTYRAWLAQNGSSTAINTMGTAFSGVASLLSGNIGGAVGSGFSIAETLARVKATEALPPQAHGAAGNSAMLAYGKKDFYFYRCTIRSEFAEIIDDYFQMFGYATHLVKIPNFHSRTYWNYVETKNAKVQGQAPQTACKVMEEILNSGITFWHDDYVGTYNRLNSIRTTS